MKNHLLITSESVTGIPDDELATGQVERPRTLYPGRANINHLTIEHGPLTELSDTSKSNELEEQDPCKATATQIALMRAEISLFIPAGNCK